MYDKLLYGKSSKENIVCIEPSDSSLELFIQDEEGNVRSEFVPNKYWLLSNKKLGNKWNRLEGDLHYCWGTQFDERSDFQKARNFHKRQDLYSIYDPKESSMVNTGITYFKGLKREQVSVLSFDIETTGLDKDAPDAKVLLIANTFRDSKGNITRRMFTYDDENLFETWSTWIREINPSIIIGHNVFSFDLPYIITRASRAGQNLDFGRDGSGCKLDSYESKFRKDGSQFYHYHKAKAYGREIIDTLFLAIKYDIGRKYESYALKQIIKQEGLESKGRVFYDASKIRTCYEIPDEWEKIKAYAEFDADDALKLYDLMIDPFFYMTQMIPKSFQEVLCTASGSQLNAMMVRSYLQEKHSIPKTTEGEAYEGGISFGNPGNYTNVFKIDVASLYPSIMRQYKVFDEDKDPKGNFLVLVDTLTKMRLEYKTRAKENKYYDNLQNAYKILINSAYGFLGAKGLNFNCVQAAAFITQTGREILEKSIEWAENCGFRIVNADTDSISCCKSDMSVFSKEEMKELIKDINTLFPELIKFEDDGVYSNVLVVRAKNYVLVKDGKTTYKGSALKATLKEPALREFIKVFINSIMYNLNDYETVYHKYVHEIFNIKDIRRWASKKTITEKVMVNSRANEANVREAIEGTDYTEGDKIYTYFDEDGTVTLVEHWKNDHSTDRLLNKLYETSETFDALVPPGTLKNYKLKRNKSELNELLNILKNGIKIEEM